MHVVIFGGHGQVALRLARRLVAGGHRVTGLVRNPDHVAEVRATGATAAVCDLEAAGVDEAAGHLRDAGAVVFAAGAGPGSGARRKDTVDRAGAVLAAQAAERAGVRRFVQISAMGVDGAPPPDAGEVFTAYLQAKAAAEEDLRDRDLDWTVLRPGRLTDDPGTGHVRLDAPPVGRADISRDDVAAVVAELVTASEGIGQTLEVVAGDVPVEEAVETLDTT